MSSNPKHKILPITNRDLLIYRFAKSPECNYLRCRDSRCKQKVYRIHGKHFKSKIGKHLSLCRFHHEQSNQTKLKEEISIQNKMTSLKQRKLSDSTYNCNNEHSTSSDSKCNKTKIKTEKVGVFEIKDVASSNGNSSSVEMDIEEFNEEDGNAISDEEIKHLFGLCERERNINNNNETYMKMFSNFVGFMEMFVKCWNQKDGSNKINDDGMLSKFKEMGVKKKPSEFGEIDINN